ncbi:MAG: hypothetical protein ACI9KE_005308 [Polyangiales bacterium]
MSLAYGGSGCWIDRARVVFGATEGFPLLRCDKMMRFTGVLAFCVAFGAIAPTGAFAQDPVGEQVTSSPKGLIGLGLIGAELGLVIPAAAGLDDTWALVTFPLVGAVGGAIAGHFLIDNNDKPKIGVAMLVTGLALVVPALVLTLSLNAYDPDDEDDGSDGDDAAAEETADEDEGTVSEPPAEVETETAALHQARVARAGGGLLRIGEAGLLVGVPNVELVPTFTQEELSRYGGNQSNELRLAVFSGAF